jgi:hypothetical protein
MVDETVQNNDASTEEHPKGLLSQHPKLGILLIAALFYVLLFGMCALVAVIIWQGRS